MLKVYARLRIMQGYGVRAMRLGMRTYMGVHIYNPHNA